ncbi:50S ribosomal protein L15 [Gammaproteobacteria bacterium]
MPLQRRLPKVGFRSMTKKYNAEVKVVDLVKLNKGRVDLNTLKEEGFVRKSARNVKLIGRVHMPFSVELIGLKVSSGAKRSIEESQGVVG